MDAMDDDGPIAVRDFPVGCVRFRRSLNNPTGPRPAEATNGGGESFLRLSEDFHSAIPRDQYLERRRLYSELSQHYQDVKKSGQLLGNRPDLQVMKHMNEQGASLDYQELGDVPGVEVGDSFNFRSEIFVVGLHRQVQGGIAWVKIQGEKIACSVVVSGGYQDNADHGEIIEYTGQGGNNYKGDKRQLEDQELKGGNKALVNSYRRNTPVRVIRGYDVDTSWNKIYSYDGLFNVISHELQVGKDGHKVYKFKLKRVDKKED